MQGKLVKMAAPHSGSANASSMDLKKTKMKSSTHGNEVLRSLGKLRCNDELCDFTVLADGKALRVGTLFTAEYVLHSRVSDTVDSMNCYIRAKKLKLLSNRYRKSHKRVQ